MSCRLWFLFGLCASVACWWKPSLLLRALPPKYVVFGEPHTHMVDIVFMLLFFRAWRVRDVRFPVNRKFFLPVLGALLRAAGAFPVDTVRSEGVVDQMIERFRTSERFVLHIPPSGTRTRTPYWRSGFYHVALGAQVPVVPAFLDAATKTYGYGAPYTLTGDPSIDMAHFRAFYADKRGFVPSNESVVRLRSEDDGVDTAAR